MHHTEWGPSGLIVEQIVRRAAKLTEEEGDRLYDEWSRMSEDADAAYGFLIYAEEEAGRDGITVKRAARKAVTVDGVEAVRDAAYAAYLSDLVGTGSLTAEHIDALMGPWLQVIGDPRIDPVCQCEEGPEGEPSPSRGTGDDRGTEPITVDLGALAPQPGDRYPWLVMEADSPEPLIVGYAATSTEALALAEKVDRPVIIWRAGKETR